MNMDHIELQKRFAEETGTTWINSQGEPEEEMEMGFQGDHNDPYGDAARNYEPGSRGDFENEFYGGYKD